MIGCHNHDQVELYGKDMNESLRKIDEASSALTTTPSALITLDATLAEAGSSFKVETLHCVVCAACSVICFVSDVISVE